MNRVATAEPPHADHAADESRTAHAIPLPDPLPTIPLGDEGIAWQGESRVVRELLAERSAAVEGTATVCQATTVKSGPHRAVYRVKLSSETFFSSISKLLTGVHWPATQCLGARPTAKPLPPRRSPRRASKRRLPPRWEPCARGLVVRESFLITREIENAAPLDQIIRERLSSTEQGALHPDASRFRRKLACALGRLTGRLHRHGLTHGDLHLANLLIQILRERRSLLVADRFTARTPALGSAFPKGAARSVRTLQRVQWNRRPGRASQVPERVLD